MKESGLAKTILELENVTKFFAPTSAQTVNVLNGVSFKGSVKDSIAITGPSGSGKSTLLNIIGAITSPSSGKVIFRNRDITKLSETELAKFRNKQIGFIFQEHHLLPQCTVMENILIPVLPYNKSRLDQYYKKGEELLTRVGLKNRMNHYPQELSVGEKLRTAVVRSLINEPAILLADEPTGSLDQKNSEIISDLILELNREKGLLLIVVTHSAEIAGKLEKIYKLDNGILRE